MGNQWKLLSESIATVPAIEKVSGLSYCTEHSGARTRHGFFGAALFTG